MDSFLSVSREVFSFYSPSKTNKTLINDYIKVVDDFNIGKDIRSTINDLITNNYLNETVIKSAFVKNVLSKRSTKLNTGMFELNTNSSRADLCLINGKSTVYEIKTEYDSFLRLDKQINNYKLFFDYLYVIVPLDDKDKVKAHITSDVGIIYYYQNRLNNISFVTKRKASLNKNINPFEQLFSLTKKELLVLNNKGMDYSWDKDALVNMLLSSKRKDEINTIYKNAIKDKYREKWLFLHKNLNNLHMLDYQWFFKNNIDYKIVYR